MSASPSLSANSSGNEHGKKRKEKPRRLELLGESAVDADLLLSVSQVSAIPDSDFGCYRPRLYDDRASVYTRTPGENPVSTMSLACCPSSSLLCHSSVQGAELLPFADPATLAANLPCA